MKKIIVLLLAIVFLFLLFFNAANAQTGSLQGKVKDTKTKEGISSSDTISLGGLSAGAYFIQLNTGQKWNTQKIIKL